MKKFTIKLDEEDLEILVDYLKYAETDVSPTIEDAILRGILEQIQDQTKP